MSNVQAHIENLTKWKNRLYEIAKEPTTTVRGKKLIKYRARLLNSYIASLIILRNFGFNSIGEMADELLRLKKLTRETQRNG